MTTLEAQEDSHYRAELGPPTPTHEAIAHDATEALEGVTVSVGEVELGQLRVSEQGAQCGLWMTNGATGHGEASVERFQGGGLALGAGFGGHSPTNLTSSCCGMSCMISFWGHWSVSLR